MAAPVAETAALTYATNASNAAAGSPNSVSVISDGTGVRQIVTLGAGDGSTTLIGTILNPLVVSGPLDIASVLGQFIATVAPGVILHGLAGSLGEAVDTTNGALNVFIKNPVPSTPVVTSVASLATNQMLLDPNTSRKQCAIFNDSTAVLYLKHGVGASTTSYTVQMPPNSYYEFPYPCYTGQVDGIWASAAGNARITESS